MVEVKEAFRNFLKCEEETEIRFAVLEMKSCNGMESHPFTKAECEFKIREGTDKESLYITVGQMFKNGILFMKDRVGKKKKKEAPKKEAFSRITEYYKSKGEKHNSFYSFLSMNSEDVNTVYINVLDKSGIYNNKTFFYDLFPAINCIKCKVYQLLKATIVDSCYKGESYIQFLKKM